MKRLILASALLGLCCLAGCTNDEVTAPNTDNVSAEPVAPASINAGGEGKEGDGGQTQSQTIDAEG